MALVCMAGLACAAQAQDQKPVLEGPKVKDLNAPTPSTFDGGPQREGKKRMDPQIPHPKYVETIKKTLGSDAPEAIRLTAEQNTKIDGIESEFQASIKAYREAHKDEIKALREQGMELGGPGGRGKGRGEGSGKGDHAKGDEMAPPPGDGMSPADSPDRKALMEKAKALRDAAPKPAEAEAKMWAVLTAEQQAAVRPKLDAMKDEMAKRSGEMAIKAKREKRGEGDGKRPEGKGPEGKEGPGGRMDPAMREKVEAMIFREKMKNATPEERQQIIEDLKNAPK
jgi:hypothetical protein